MTIELLFDVGDSPTVTATFVPNPDLNPPGSMEGYFKVRKPDGSQTTFLFTDPEVTLVSGFTYRLQVPVLDQSGNWAVHAIGSSGIQAGEKLRFTVLETVVDSPLIP